MKSRVRAGRLKHRITIRQLVGDPPVASDVVTIWGDIVDAGGSQTSDISPASGLRSPLPVIIYARYHMSVYVGLYAVYGGRLFYIDQVRNPEQANRELILSCTELAGETTVYTPSGGSPINTRGFLRQGVRFAGGEYSARADYNTQIELPIAEVGRARRGDGLTLRQVNYTVLGLDEEGDDGVVRRVWIREAA